MLMTANKKVVLNNSPVPLLSSFYSRGFLNRVILAHIVHTTQNPSLGCSLSVTMYVSLWQALLYLVHTGLLSDGQHYTKNTFIKRIRSVFDFTEDDDKRIIYHIKTILKLTKAERETYIIPANVKHDLENHRVLTNSTEHKRARRTFSLVKRFLVKEEHMRAVRKFLDGNQNFNHDDPSSITPEAVLANSFEPDDSLPSLNSFELGDSLPSLNSLEPVDSLPSLNFSNPVDSMPSLSSFESVQLRLQPSPADTHTVFNFDDFPGLHEVRSRYTHIHMHVCFKTKSHRAYTHMHMPMHLTA
jgi:hypothetical protein